MIYMNRVDKTNYYLNIAETVCDRSTCLRRKFGAVIVKDDEIISTGYNGAPRGRVNCSDIGSCYRAMMNVPRGQRYELCRSVHAEANAIISAARSEMIGADLYLACHDAETNQLDSAVEPCSMCKRMILNAGIRSVYVKASDGQFVKIDVRSWIEADDSLRENQTGY